MISASFGSGNQGQQIAHNSGIVNTEFHLHPEQPETPPTPFAAIPFSRDPDFVERGDILAKIKRRCSESPGRAALVGLGGVGKSQLAIEYAYRVAAEQPDTWVFWVHAGTQARVEEGLRAIADAVKLYGRNQAKADIPQLVYNWLSNERHGRWIIILDSADDRDVFYGPTSDNACNSRTFAMYLPQSRNGSIIITTRDKDLAFRLTGRRQNMIEVGPMTQSDALALLEKRLGGLPDIDVAVDLVQALDLVPLAISQAAAYIQARAPRSSPEKYLTEFQESERKRSKLLQHDAGDLRRDGGASNAILSTWQISFDDIRSRRPSAADLLSLMSFFDRQGISEALLKPCPEAQELDEGSSVSGESGDSDSAKSAGEAEDVFEDDVSMLRDYCLVTPNEDGNVFEIHGLVQLSTRKWLERHGKEEEFKHQFVSRIAALFPTGDYRNWATCQQLFPHVERAIDYRPAEAKLGEAWATLLYRGGWYAELQGRYDVAEQMAGKSRRSREKRFGKEDERTLVSTSLFAEVLRDKGRWSEAEKLFVQVMETSKTKLGADHPDTLTSMNNLAFTWKSQGRHEDSLVLLQDCVETQQRVLGPKHPDTLSSLTTVSEWSS